MKRSYPLIIALISFCLSAGLSAQAAFQAGSYKRIDIIEDWGAQTRALILNLGSSISQGSADTETFTVEVSRSDNRMSEALEGGSLSVIEAYVSDDRGRPLPQSRYLTLVLESGPEISLSSPLNYYDKRNEWIDARYTISQVKDIESAGSLITGLRIDTLAEVILPDLEDFSYGAAYADGHTMGYASYEPKDNGTNARHPLIIWLHGGGEGGSDSTIPLAANRASALAQEPVQDIFGNAYVLIPQAPTKWMDDGSGEERPYLSLYTKALKSLIDSYIAEHRQIDTSRIYIGGCSNGGFMTIRMLLDYPDFFAAAFPVCEGMLDSHLQQEDIESLANQHIWFVLAASDTTLPGIEYSLPTYERLIKAGGKHIFLSYLPRITDSSGRYTQKDGSPYEYDGHWAWIPVYNNELSQIIDGKNMSLMEWLARQTRQ